MAYQQFMYEEAFEFHDNQVVHQLKANTINKPDEFTIHHAESEQGDEDPSTQRLPPLGACSNEPIEQQPQQPSDHQLLDIKEYLNLQEQHEQLNASLFALTSHFAQIQFRLKQIINGPKNRQEQLLEELEDFAFTGCPDVCAPHEKETVCPSCVSHKAIEQYQNRIEEEKEREQRLDNHLKKMISELEVTQRKYERGKRHSKSGKSRRGYQRLSRQLERSTKIDVSESESESEKDEEVVEKVDAGQSDDLKKHIDKTLAKLINPRQAKQSMITQVTKQISDMEKFVDFLNTYDSATDSAGEQQNTPKDAKVKNSATSNTSVGNKTPQQSLSATSSESVPAPHTKILKMSEEKRKRVHDASVAILKKGLAVLQIFAISQFGCSAKHFQEHMMTKSENATVSKTGHVKPLGQLRSAVDHIMMLHTKLVEVGGLNPDSEDELNLPISSADKRASWSRAKSHSVSRSRANSTSSVMSSHGGFKPIETAVQEELIKVVRGDLANALKELLQHGLFESFSSKTLSTKALVGCMSSHSVQGNGMHIWEYFGKFYSMKHGRQFNTQPSMMLSEAFAMDIGCTQQTPKQSLLTVYHRIKTTHECRKRSFDAMFKALVSAGLNRGRLAQWIRLVIRMPGLVDHHYEKWSYVVKSGFDDVLTSLEKLSSLTFFLPEDLAIRHLLKNTNEFGDA